MKIQVKMSSRNWSLNVDDEFEYFGMRRMDDTECFVIKRHGSDEKEIIPKIFFEEIK